MTEAHRKTDGPREPEAGAGRYPLNFPPGKHDGAGGEKGDARRHRFHNPQRIEADAIVEETSETDAFERDDAEGAGCKADEHMGLEPRRPRLCLALEADDGT
ncbi:hypothetical protein D9M70_504120 [compost metagenome]